MKAKWLPLAAGVALAAGSVAASAVDFHGYFRSGIQVSGRGGDVFCGGDGTAGHKVGRLGDECDTYAEIALGQELYNKANRQFNIYTRMAYGTSQSDDGHDTQWNDWQAAGGSGDGNADPWSGGRIAIREFWGNYVTDDYTLWAGKRFYQRKDIHIWDIYTLSTAGYGVGIENINVGVGNLNFAVMKNSSATSATDTGAEDTTYRNSYNIDLRWNGIGLGSFGSLDAAVIYGIPMVSKYQEKHAASYDDKKKVWNKAPFSEDSGVLLTLDHALSVDSLMNHFIVQWGTNGFSDVGAFGSNGTNIYTSGKHIYGVRLVDWGTYDIADFSIGYGLFWGYINHGKHSSGSWSRPNDGWEYSITVRPSYKWTEYTRTTLEAGYSQKKNGTHDGWTIWAKDLNDDPDIYKVTLAQEVTPGKGFWQRPAIRFYASYQGGDQFESKVGLQKLGNHNFQWSFGSQIEAWW